MVPAFCLPSVTGTSPGLLQEEDVGSLMFGFIMGGRRYLRRNVAVALGNSGDRKALPCLEIAAKDEDPLVSSHAEWAIEKIKNSWNIEKCFRFLNGYPVDSILNGVANLDELHENLKYAESTESLTPEELKGFEKEVAPLEKDFCRRCGYCMPCPNDIIIPVMIHLLWQTVRGYKYEDLPDQKKEMGENLAIWWPACEECSQCEEKCPYNLPIIKRKNELIEMFSSAKQATQLT